VPFYEYQCGKCGVVHEAFHKMSDPALVTCPSCGGALRRVFHPVAVHFKGSGFYTTDYGRTGEKRGSDGYAAVEKERLRRAEQGDALSQRVLEAESSSSSTKKPSDNGGASKEKQKAT
jgi:putative FmdB family regulatory protein